MEPGILSLPRTLSVLSVGQVYYTRTPVASANFGVINIGDAPFDGLSAGKFVGSANGTYLAINAPSGFTGNLFNCAIGGAGKFAVQPGSIRSNYGAPTGSLNAAFALGDGAFSGTQPPGFNGNANGTYLGINMTSSTADLMNLQVSGVSKFSVTNGGIVTLAASVNPAQNTPTYANPLSLDPTLANTFIITTTSGVGNATVNLATSPPAGQFIWLIINNDAGGARTITFGTHFRMVSSTIIGTASKVMVVQCISDGTNAIEVARTVAIT